MFWWSNSNNFFFYGKFLIVVTISNLTKLLWRWDIPGERHTHPYFLHRISCIEIKMRTILIKKWGDVTSQFISLEHL